MGGLAWWGGLATLGLLVGYVAGLFGVGGGFLMTPLLVLIFRVPYPVAIGTGLCQMIGAATAALLRHRRLGQGEIKIDYLMLAGSLLGVRLGADAVNSLGRLGSVTPLRGGHAITWAHLTLSLSYMAMLGGIAFWMGRDSHRPMRPAGETVPPGPLARLALPPYTRLPATGHRISIAVVAYAGLLTGFLSGLLGIGGGSVLIPVFIYGIGMRVRMAAGTGVLVLLVSALFGTYEHALAGHVNLGIALTLLIGSAIGAQLGALTTSRADGRKLRRAYIYIVLGTVAAVVWDLARTIFADG